MKSQNPKPKLGKIWAALIKGALKFVERKLRKVIKDDIAYEGVTLLTTPLKATADALSDSDPDDKAQIAGIAKRHLNIGVIPYVERRATDLAMKIKNDELRQFVTTVDNIPFAVARIYTDDNPNNDNQLLGYIEAWLEDKENQEVIINVALRTLIEKVFDVETAEFLIGLINNQIAGINFDFDKDGD